MKKATTPQTIMQNITEKKRDEEIEDAVVKM